MQAPPNPPRQSGKKTPPSQQVIRKRMILFFLQVFSVMMLLTLVTFSFILISRSFGGDSVPVVTTVPTTIAPTDPPIPATPTPSPSPSLVPAPEEYLPDSPKAEAYFGPLPVAETPEPVRNFEVRGIYIGNGASMSDKIEAFKDSEVNTFVLDLKEADGVYFDCTNELANSLGVVRNAFKTADMVKKAHDAGFKLVGRIVCFKDPKLATAHPDRSIKDAAGNTLKFTNEENYAFANPYDTRNWDYYIDLALEAVAAGVDEIQFDYVRFPTGKTSTGEKPYFGDPEAVPSRIEVINRFLQTARVRIQDEHGVPVTADVFGIIIASKIDATNLGQEWGTLGLTGISAVSPMIYPSHYALNTVINGVKFEKPDHRPHDLIYNALMSGKTAASVEHYSVVRPYLQAFTAKYIGAGNWIEYTYKEINDQIKATYAAGYKEWVLWNSGGKYPEGKYDGK